MKPLSPLDQQKILYSRQLAAHTFRQWYAAQEGQRSHQEMPQSFNSDPSGKEGDDKPAISEQENKASQLQLGKKG